MNERFRARCEQMNAETRAPWGGAGVETIAAFLDDIEVAIPAECQYRLRPEQAWGLSPEQRRELARNKGTRRNRRAGYTALKSKYGEAAAKNIISRARS